MDLKVLQERLANIPYMQPWQGAIIYNTIIGRGYRSCLELGVFHGVGTCYIAGALHELGRGKVMGMDLKWATRLEPRADKLIESLGLSDYAEVIFGESSYTWYLMDRLEHGDLRFDFCYLDDAHTWDLTGFGFLLVERLLDSGGMIIFDDVDWTFADGWIGPKPPALEARPEREKATKQVRKVFDLLVKGNPAFSEVWEENGWGYAVKK